MLSPVNNIKGTHTNKKNIYSCEETYIIIKLTLS